MPFLLGVKDGGEDSVGVHAPPLHLTPLLIIGNSMTDGQTNIHTPLFVAKLWWHRSNFWY